MHIGILVHSSTGHTLRFSQVIADRLRKEDHKVELVELQTDKPVNSRTQNFAITNIPDCHAYDVVLVGGPVWGGNASQVIKSCIRSLTDISGKKVVPFVTMAFPWPFLGGNQAIQAMAREATAVGGKALPGKIVTRLFHNTEELMNKAATEITQGLA